MSQDTLLKLYVKAAFPHVLGCKYDAYITGEFITKKEAEESDDVGEVMTRAAFDKKNKSWAKNAITPVVE